MKTMILVPGQLDFNQLKNLLACHTPCVLNNDCLTKVNASAEMVQTIIREKKIVYGINTGFGSLASQVITPENLQQLQKNIILSHATGVGNLLDDDIVALILILKINSLAQGYSGVRLELIETLLTFYNLQIYPCIPAKGSVGASGDLVPLAHMALPLIGEGTVRYNNQIMDAPTGLALANLSVLQLAPKEGLALLNGLQVSAALAIKALFLTEKLFHNAIIAGSLSVDAARGSDIPFDDKIHKIRGHESQRYVASLFRALLEGSEIRDSHRYCERVQDPYSLRCQPQIMGAVWQQLVFVKQTLEDEVNAVTDNPLVFVETNEILSGGNFHGEMIAMAADNLALAIAEIGANAERRIALLIDKNFSGLPAFLVKENGLNSGFMIAHVTAAACASDNKALSHPHCVDSLPTSANQEDHVSMATNAAARLFQMIDNTATILAIELLAATQGLEFHLPLVTSPKLLAIYNQIRTHIPPYDRDRYFAPDITLMKENVLEGVFLNREPYEFD